MCIKYDTVEYAASRLKGTVVRHKNIPVMVLDIANDGLATIETLVKGSVKSVNMHELDTTPVPLGYVNYKGNAFYVCRMPKRHDWKQGFRWDNSTILKSGLIGRIPMNAVALTIYGKYPNLQNSLTRVREGKVSAMAWCRDFCFRKLDDCIAIEYMGEHTIGTVSAGGVPQLHGKYSYLKERLQRNL